MTETRDNFAEMFEESMAHSNIEKGAIVEAIVVDIRADRVLVNAGLKSDALIPAAEFRNEKIAVGDQVEVVIETLENGFGETRLSHEKARRAKAWVELEKLQDKGELVTGQIIERVKGGFTVALDTIQAFLPGSLVDVKPVRDPDHLKGKELEFAIINIDRLRNNVVLSRRAVIEREYSAEREARLEELQEGQEVIGVVKNITDYGAFIDLGGVDGLLHITDMAWKRVKHPSELLGIGNEVKVKVLKFDKEKSRVSLGMKQLTEDPWVNIARRYPASTRIAGRVTNVTDYGCFVELEEGVEGLVHMSEMDWTNKNVHPGKIVQVGDEVEAMVLEIDEDRRRISLGIKQCKSNPWEEFAEKNQKNEKIKGKIRSITDFGMFIGLEGDIDGLVHLSDISWTEPGEACVRNYNKGDEVEAVILAIDPERERISLGIKQLETDPIEEFLEGRDEDAVIDATVKQIDAKQATVQLSENIDGRLRIADYSYDRIKDLRDELKEGEEIAVKIINFDRKNHQLFVSHKVLEKAPKGEVQPAVEAKATTTLGDLLREQMKAKEEKD